MNLITWPFRAVWQLFTTILSLTGRLVAIVVGLVLVVVGLVLTITVVGSVFTSDQSRLMIISPDETLLISGVLVS